MNDKPTSNDVWYYAQEGQSFGPFTYVELLQKAAEGVVKSDTLVVPQGESEWRQFSSLGKPQPKNETTVAVSAEDKPQSIKNEKAKGCGCALIIGIAFSIWVNSRPTPQETTSSSTATERTNIQQPFTITEAKYIIWAARKLQGEAAELMANEAWQEPPGGTFNPVKNWKFKAKVNHDEIFSLYGYDARLRNEDTVRRLVVEALQRMSQAMLYFEDSSRDLMQSEMQAGEELLARAEQALQGGNL